jgi:hypothetical protein
MTDTVKWVRKVVYVPEEEYDQLRARLVLERKTVSSWVREKIREEGIQDADPQSPHDQVPPSYQQLPLPGASD